MAGVIGDQELPARPPRYDGANLLNLAATIDAALGNASPYPLLADTGLRERLLGARRIVLWLIDGLGVAPLQRLAPASALARALRGELSSVYPSSTAPALTTLATARAPVAHAAPEWFLWFDELGAIYRALPLDARSPVAGLPPVADAAGVYPAPSLASRANRPVWAVMPAHLAESAYTRYAHRGARIVPVADDTAFLEAVLRAVDGSPAGGYVFAYEPRFDEAAHGFGVASAEAAAVVARLDALFERLAAQLAARDALLVVTADHGFIDVPAARRLRLEDFPRVQRLLERPLCGGPRAPFCYVAGANEEAFVAAVRSDLGEHFVAVPSRLLVERGWFGPGAPERRLLSRIGTHVLLPRTDAYLVDRVPGETSHPLIGMHGGPTPAELRVPVITN
jgi:hypothetical protein